MGFLRHRCNIDASRAPWCGLRAIGWLVARRRAVYPGPLGVRHNHEVQPQKTGVMDAHDAEHQALAFEEAIQFLAVRGNAERALAQHRQLADGLCSGCLTQLTRWPCPVATFALMAQQRQR
jgi:hypothetical protein